MVPVEEKDFICSSLFDEEGPGSTLSLEGDESPVRLSTSYEVEFPVNSLLPKHDVTVSFVAMIEYEVTRFEMLHEIEEDVVGS